MVETPHVNPLRAAGNLQNHINETELWFRKLCISLNAEKNQACLFHKVLFENNTEIVIKRRNSGLYIKSELSRCNTG